MRYGISGMAALGRGLSFSVLLLGATLAGANTDMADSPLEDAQTVTDNNSAQGIAILSDALGNVVTLYEANQSDDNDAILARRFPNNSDGLGEPVIIDTLTAAESRLDSEAAMESDGDIVLVWNQLPEANSGERPLVLQRFDRDFQATGGRSILTANANGLADMDVNDNGDMAVAWPIDNDTVFGAQVIQRFNDQGDATSDMFTLVDDDNELITDVAIAPSGAFVASYIDGRSDSTRNASVYVQLFDAQGQRLGDPIQVNSDATDSFRTAVDMDTEGRFVVAWSDDDAEIVTARRFDSTGQPLGEQFQVSGNEGNRDPRLAYDAKGRFVVLWRGNDEVFARRYNAQGEPAEVVTLYSGQTPAYLDVASDADGDYAAIWTEISDNSPDRGIYARRYVGAENVDLAVSLVPANNSVAPGATVGYRLAVDNNHEIAAPVRTELPGANTINQAIGAATGVVTTVTLPAGLSEITISDQSALDGRSFDCNTAAATTRTCRLAGALYAGESLSARITATAGDKLQTLESTVAVTARQFDSDESSDTGNNRDSASVSVTADSAGDASDAGGNEDDDSGSGGGCTMAGNAAFDPTFFILLACAGLLLASRHRKRVDVRRAAQ